MENERDEAKKEVQIARLAAVAKGDSRARVEDDLARVQDALAIAEEAKRKAEVETAFNPKQVKTKKPWRRTTKRPWR